ncbi:coiled-coil domain-containing protein 124 isoform X3 [Phascolarctos cinereus]|uniref:Coiled-coil domain-containing protein 124 n=1 Tax=Phascolarctos cinereus TaxID=38626 RepID=A0A6P5M823_PHACI|nr:coiled-coil domain-containing protein 124 [Phascolarctos cinereus]XP_036596937.1 coiled-coil domain-containing protein 124 [Trichosurus vulpecula]XP_036596938.1 coiled-coil domain-containing protein 124 [Trichosurus vulpecula]
MPKKFQGENTKSAAARARKAEAKAAADAKRQQELEDAYWKDDDKHVMRKEQRKEEKEKRRLEQLERKKELQRLLEEEDSKLKGKSPKPLTPGKVTRAQIEETLRRDQQQKENEETVDKPKSHLEVPLEENVNRRVPEEGSVEARTIEDAIAVLSVNDDSDRHPERRMKAAFTAFEELHLPRLKKENPNMRLSQLKQLLKKEWMRSPDNPMNQRTMAYNAQK